MDKMNITRGVNQPSLSFVDITSGIVKPHIWTELENGMWKDFLIDNHLKNDTLGDVDQNKWLTIFPNYKVINPGFKWDASNGQIVADLYNPKSVHATLDSFLNAAENYFKKFEGKKIGVHLSGGLDSSLIISLLKYFNIPFVAIGLCSHRFEFRTEKRVQEIMAGYANDALLLDMDDYPFFSNLESKPKHQIPDANIKMIDASMKLAEEFAKRGCNVVFSGQGGDTLLVDSMADLKDFAGYNIGNEFAMPYEQDCVYQPIGIELHSFFSCKEIIDQITSLRVNEKDDSLKIWARKFFKDFLPRELSEFTYCADFFGHSMDGLNKSKPTFKLLFEEAYDYFKHPLFEPKGIKKILDTDLLALEYSTYCEFCAKLSIAVWLHALFRDEK